jgi:DNA-binding HxlR family transcriptional regulator
MEWNPYFAQCPTRQVLDYVGNKWTVLILGLLAKEPKRFNEIRRAIEGLSQKVLSQRLKELEREGLVDRKAFATVPVTVEYSLTPLGMTLVEGVEKLREWAEHNMDSILAARTAFDRRHART